MKVMINGVEYVPKSERPVPDRRRTSITDAKGRLSLSGFLVAGQRYEITKAGNYITIQRLYEGNH